MGIILAWIEMWAVAALWAALMTACCARWLSKPLAVGTAIVLAFVPVGVFVAAVIVEARLARGSWSWRLLAATAFITAFAILWRGLRGAEGYSMTARRWPAKSLAAALMFAVVLHGITLASLDAAARAMLTGMRSEAGALALSVAPPPVADHKNAAAAYAIAFDLLPQPSEWPGGDYQELLNRARNGDSEVTKFLEQSAGALAWLRKAAALPDCNFARDYGRPSISMSLIELDSLRTAARLLSLDAVHQAATGNSMQAAEDIRAMYAISRHAKQEPLLISLLVAGSIDGMALETLEIALTQAEALAKQLEHVRFDPTTSFQSELPRAMQMEEAFGLSVFADLTGTFDVSALVSVGEPSRALSSSAAEMLGAYWRIYLMPADLADYRRASQNLRTRSSKPYHQTAALLPDESAELAHTGYVTRLIVPGLNAAHRAIARIDARHRLAQLLIAAAQHHAREGKYPDDLATLVAREPLLVTLDPFNGQPLRLLRKDGGIVLYSVGQNLTDDDGATAPNDPEQGDIAVGLGTKPATIP